MVAAARVGRAATTSIRRCFLQVWAKGLNRLVVLDSSGRVAARPWCGDISRPDLGFPVIGSAKRLGAGVQTAQPGTKVRKDRAKVAFLQEVDSKLERDWNFALEL
ncbi:hypothetical protein OROGR_009065 [Orobanche gracilis]